MSEFEKLFEIPDELRTEAWESAFLALLSQAKVRIVSPDPQQGPDGWPYLMVALAQDTDEMIGSVLLWLSTRGIGLVINPQKTTPDYVLSYGMIWNFRQRGEFLTSAPTRPPSEVIELGDGQRVLAGSPSEDFLPAYVRAVLKQFLLDQGVFAPKVLMVSFDLENFDLCFSLESLKSPPAHERSGIAEALAWFLPSHYAVSLVSENIIPGFLPL